MSKADGSHFFLSDCETIVSCRLVFIERRFFANRLQRYCLNFIYTNFSAFFCEKSMFFALKNNKFFFLLKNLLVSAFCSNFAAKFENMNILVTGCNGQLGTEMRNLSASHPQHKYCFTDVFVPENSDVQRLDITDREEVKRFVAGPGIEPGTS